MSDWYTTILNVKGPVRRFLEFAAFARGHGFEPWGEHLIDSALHAAVLVEAMQNPFDYTFDFARFVPPSPEDRAAIAENARHGWRMVHWGAKWNAAEVHAQNPRFFKNGKAEIRFSLDIAWSAPTGILKSLPYLFPELAFAACGRSEGEKDWRDLDIPDADDGNPDRSTPAVFPAESWRLEEFPGFRAGDTWRFDPTRPGAAAHGAFLRADPAVLRHASKLSEISPLAFGWRAIVDRLWPYRDHAGCERVELGPYTSEDRARAAINAALAAAIQGADLGTALPAFCQPTREDRLRSLADFVLATGHQGPLTAHEYLEALDLLNATGEVPAAS